MLIWFITGTSRGLGVEFATAALARGDAVVATARDPSKVEAKLGPSDRLLALALDVTDPDSIERAVAAALERFGRVDVLINNAGRGLIGAVEEASEREIREVFEINVFGLLAVTRALLPAMREQRSGAIVNISSVGGFATRAGGGIYGGTKFAVEAFTEALNEELAPLGIHVMVVEPGGFRTDFLDASSIVVSALEIDDYTQTAGGFRRVVNDGSYVQLGDPRKAAEVVIEAVTSEHPPLRLPLGADALERIEAKLGRLDEDIAGWRERSVATAYDG
ncbi:MAG TPA: oxidoreductase [Solirubrobacteraceae bacterium]|jgi:NAD(P)-dependent dehydrogenase (short-subunit alcohol dehydrogenase family)